MIWEHKTILTYKSVLAKQYCNDNVCVIELSLRLFLNIQSDMSFFYIVDLEIHTLIENCLCGGWCRGRRDGGGDRVSPCFFGSKHLLN